MVVWDPHQPFGGLTREQVEAARLILWKGHCSVHVRFSAKQIAQVRIEHPGVHVIVHPEVPFEVVEAADDAGSTAGEAAMSVFHGLASLKGRHTPEVLGPPAPASTCAPPSPPLAVVVASGGTVVAASRGLYGAAASAALAGSIGAVAESLVLPLPASLPLTAEPLSVAVMSLPPFVAPPSAAVTGSARPRRVGSVEPVGSSGPTMPSGEPCASPLSSAQLEISIPSTF